MAEQYPNWEDLSLEEKVNFGSKAGYQKWLAYGHMHGVFKGKQKVTIRGKAHKVNHSKGGKKK